MVCSESINRGTLVKYASKNSESDISVVGTKAGYSCKDCELAKGVVDIATMSEMIKHLRKHIVAGHQVPGQVMLNLRKEAPCYG